MFDEPNWTLYDSLFFLLLESLQFRKANERYLFKLHLVEFAIHLNDFLAGLSAVHDRHVQVEYDHVEVLRVFIVDVV